MTLARIIKIETGGPFEPPPIAIARSLAGGVRLDGRFDLRLHGFKIEARALLHGWEVDGSLGQFAHHLLHEHETPELVSEPVVVGDRAIVLAVVHAGPLERIETEV